jgi:F-type H+-transporting ATPase subunit delta
MGQLKVAKRYGKALFDLALESGKLEEAMQDLTLIKSLSHKDLAIVLVSPVVTSYKKVNIFTAIFAKHIQPLTLAFFKLVFLKGRSIAIKEIIEAFSSMYREQKGIKVVKLTTAIPLSDDIKKIIGQELQKSSLLTGKTIELNEKVDPSIIGGLTIQVDDQLFDASIKHDLQHIKRQFIKNMYVSEI